MRELLCVGYGECFIVGQLLWVRSCAHVIVGEFIVVFVIVGEL